MTLQLDAQFRFGILTKHSVRVIDGGNPVSNTKV